MSKIVIFLSVPLFYFEFLILVLRIVLQRERDGNGASRSRKIKRYDKREIFQSDISLVCTHLYPANIQKCSFYY